MGKDGTGKIKLNSGENDIKIDVTAENGTVRTYHIIINKTGKVAENNEIQNEEAILNQNQENITQIDESQTSNKNMITYAIATVLIVIIIIIIATRKKK